MTTLELMLYVFIILDVIALCYLLYRIGIIDGAKKERELRSEIDSIGPQK
jgi:hypothetical protein